MKSIVMHTETPCGDIVFTKFTVSASKRTFLCTTEIKIGKIVMIATALST